MKKNGYTINEVTGLYPVRVKSTARPETVEEVCKVIRKSTGPISIGGGRFSQGGQTASPGSLHLDMRKLNKIVNFSPTNRTIRVQAGIRWCDVQKFLDPHDLSVKIMQTYANFTVGGSLGVNAHGRYVDLGPLILSVREINIVLANGKLVTASPTQNREIFYGAVGGYGGLGVIVEAELDLAENTRVERIAKKLPTTGYLSHFRRSVLKAGNAVFHNGDLYPPHYKKMRSVTWFETDKPVTVPQRLMPLNRSYILEKYFMWAISETPLGKWRREYILDPFLYLRPKVHWRNYEAGYNVAELEPPSKEHKTYVLQEYFVPIDRFDEFVPKMAKILQRHKVNIINISARHAIKDPGSYLAWARKEVVAFVVYYKQGTTETARNHVAIWTRELIDAVISVDGAYYLPYQPHATVAQFHAAYPQAKALFGLKKKLDPQFRFRNVIWDTYYAPTLTKPAQPPKTNSEFHKIYSDHVWRDKFFLFLQNIYRLFPEDRFHQLIIDACAKHANDREIYTYIQKKLPTIKPFLGDLFYALPSLKKQKQEMTRQTRSLLDEKKDFHGYLEIGSTGRYISHLRKVLNISGPLYLVNDFEPTMSPVDMAERGQFTKLGHFEFLNDYQPLSSDVIAENSVELATCYIGLHHAPPRRLDPFVRSVRRVLRPGGIFILRDHDVTNREMDTFVSLVHTVFNAGINVSWEDNQNELRHFAPIAKWSRYLAKLGFKDTGQRLLQDNDPSDNTLMAFIKE